MSLHDEIRDELYGREGIGAEEGAALSAVEEVLESASYPHSAFKVLAVAVAAEIGFLAMSLFAGHAAGDALYDPEVSLYLAVAVFVTGFLIGFTTFRMFEHSWGTVRPRSETTSPSILAGNAPKPYSGSLWIWFIASAAGVSNIILFYAVIS